MENKGLRVHKDPRALRALLGKLELLDPQGRKVKLDLLVLLDILAALETKETRVHRAEMVPQEAREREERMAFKVRGDPQDQEDSEEELGEEEA